ncbi:transketolase [Clostridium botulinum]|uniref:Transketolase, thiamine diphosphate binding subunit n=3 Tax=Clostridium botulinum TaxID=1491 RepID=A7GIZ1_CLOBL|nr:transketolase [Clostridium botulinum]KRU28915.1 transketolase [Clostridium sporogenes]ABS42119.1 transketolase, thiamine diphosphate binding subunit [Clostridium botulinum F str. Langeland]ADG01108.1 transketolase, thiamine diphosphate binding subunit [Clostridium botulinum F str. 230613]KKM42017.1 transketolase [Clostridium botulinum]KRU32408.1 transketolase [Clostridium sporogenes]
MKKNIEELQDIARVIRKDIVSMLTESASGHPGGSLSAVEILTALYFNEMNIDPTNTRDLNRDRFVLSKGHAAPVLYSTLARRGFFNPEELKTLRKIGSILQGHPNMNDVPGIDMSTGSLGQGISTAVGMAVAGKLDEKDYRVYTLLGDGELEEGQVWEAAMAAAHYKLDNLTAFVDYNGLQIDGPCSEVMSAEPIADKFRAFNWNVIEIDGHDFNSILNAIESSKNTKERPTMIVCKTIKGKGVSFMENEAGWHGKAPSAEECEKAICEIGGDK